LIIFLSIFHVGLVAGNILGQLLQYENPFQIRKRALEILLLLLEFLGDNADPSLLAVLASAVNYLPFCHNEPKLEQMLRRRKDNGLSH
jgi:hypothetical protein